MNDRMEFRNLVIGIVLLLQSALGILGNFSLLFYYLHLFCHEGPLKTIDLILTHLCTANSLIILSKGMLQITRAFGSNQIYNEVGCNLILYILRLGRSMSINTTCLLSVFQAITISPRNTCWNVLKAKTPKFIGFSISLCWILYMVLNILFPWISSSRRNRKNVTQRRHYELCASSRGYDNIVESLYTAFWVVPEVLLSVLLVCSSSSMIIILHAHKKRVQYLHSSHASPSTSPESRATKNILVLVFNFLALYTISSILQCCITFSKNPGWWLSNITAIISMCFPTLCPFVVSHDSTASRFCFSWIRSIRVL